MEKYPSKAASWSVEGSSIPVEGVEDEFRTSLCAAFNECLGLPTVRENHPFYWYLPFLSTPHPFSPVAIPTLFSLPSF